MDEAWIDLACPACGERWEASPADLPEPGGEHACRHCGETREMREFPHTIRDLEVLGSFHQ